MAEPCPRDTAACVGLAAEIVAQTRPRGDDDRDAGRPRHPARPRRSSKTVRAAVAVIDADPSPFVTFGIKPTRPETGYGYIERGESLGTPEGIALHQVVQFREKPDRATAERFLADGRFAWNSGIFVWRGRAILDALGRHRPSFAAGARPHRRRPSAPPKKPRRSPANIPQMERVPIDKAVMEKATNVRVLEVVYDWSDVGDWRALTDLIPTTPTAIPSRAPSSPPRPAARSSSPTTAV